MRFFASVTVRDMVRGQPLGTAALVKVQLDADNALEARALAALEAERACIERYGPWTRCAQVDDLASFDGDQPHSRSLANITWSELPMRK
jgi:hypothetical protein